MKANALLRVTEESQSVAGSARNAGHAGPAAHANCSEFLDVQGPLLRAASLPERLEQERDSKITAWIVAGCGWAVVGVMLALI